MFLAKFKDFFPDVIIIKNLVSFLGIDNFKQLNGDKRQYALYIERKIIQKY